VLPFLGEHGERDGAATFWCAARSPSPPHSAPWRNTARCNAARHGALWLPQGNAARAVPRMDRQRERRNYRPGAEKLRHSRVCARAPMHTHTRTHTRARAHTHIHRSRYIAALYYACWNVLCVGMGDCKASHARTHARTYTPTCTRPAGAPRQRAAADGHHGAVRCIRDSVRLARARRHAHAHTRARTHTGARRHTSLPSSSSPPAERTVSTGAPGLSQ
jgi:hypothetical protein